MDMSTRNCWRACGSVAHTQAAAGPASQSAYRPALHARESSCARITHRRRLAGAEEVRKREHCVWKGTEADVLRPVRDMGGEDHVQCLAHREEEQPIAAACGVTCCRPRTLGRGLVRVTCGLVGPIWVRAADDIVGASVATAAVAVAAAVCVGWDAARRRLAHLADEGCSAVALGCDMAVHLVSCRQRESAHNAIEHAAHGFYVLHSRT